MASYEIRFTKEAVKDINTLSPCLRKKLKDIARNLISVETIFREETRWRPERVLPRKVNLQRQNCVLG